MYKLSMEYTEWAQGRPTYKHISKDLYISRKNHDVEQNCRHTF